MKEARDLGTEMAADAIIFLLSNHVEGRTIIMSLKFLTAVQTRSTDWTGYAFYPEIPLRAAVN
jgi:hypothetical protein